MVVAVGDEGSCDAIVEASPEATISDVMKAIESSSGEIIARKPGYADYEINQLPWNQSLANLDIHDGDMLYLVTIGGIGGRGDDRVVESEIYYLLRESPLGTLAISELEQKIGSINIPLQEPLEHYLQILEEDNLVVRRNGVIVACTQVRYGFEVEYPQPLVAGDDCLLSVSLNYMKGGGVAVAKEIQSRVPAKELYFKNGYVDYSQPMDTSDPYQLKIKPECSGTDIRPNHKEVALGGDWHYADDIHGQPLQFVMQFASAGHKTLALNCMEGDNLVKSIKVPLVVIERAFALGKWTVSSSQFVLIQFIFGLIGIVGVVAAVLALIH